MSEDLETYTMTLQEERDYYCKCMRELQERIDEAIKYIKQYNLEGVKLNSDYWYDCLIELLEILGG